MSKNRIHQLLKFKWNPLWRYWIIEISSLHIRKRFPCDLPVQNFLRKVILCLSQELHFFLMSCILNLFFILFLVASFFVFLFFLPQHRLLFRLPACAQSSVHRLFYYHNSFVWRYFSTIVIPFFCKRALLSLCLQTLSSAPLRSLLQFLWRSWVFFSLEFFLELQHSGTASSNVKIVRVSISSRSQGNRRKKAHGNDKLDPTSDSRWTRKYLWTGKKSAKTFKVRKSSGSILEKFIHWLATTIRFRWSVKN